MMIELHRRPNPHFLDEWVATPMLLTVEHIVVIAHDAAFPDVTRIVCLGGDVYHVVESYAAVKALLLARGWGIYGVAT